MAYTAQQIADAYLETVAKGTMTEAQFGAAAAEMGINASQLVAAQQVLLGNAPPAPSMGAGGGVNELANSASPSMGAGGGVNYPPNTLPYTPGVDSVQPVNPVVPSGPVNPALAPGMGAGGGMGGSSQAQFSGVSPSAALQSAPLPEGYAYPMSAPMGAAPAGPRTYSAQEIADAYRETVAKGAMTEAQFVAEAANLGINTGQLLAARQVLTGVAPDITSLPRQEVVNYLRASTPGQTQITPVQDPNLVGPAVEAAGPGGERFTPIYSPQQGEGGGELLGYTRYLAEFDPTYEGGQFGSYVGIYDTNGNLQDVQFQKGERNAGAIQEFATRYGYVIPMAVAAAAAAGMLPDFSALGGAQGTTLGGADLVGSDWATVNTKTPVWLNACTKPRGTTSATF
jgi:hypothetical protein